MQSSSQQEYEQRINRVLTYIYTNLSKDLSVDELAKVSCFSPYHFHRLFTALVGESVGSYQRRLRLEKANHMLRFNPSKSITDIALDMGFNSPGAFNRAFKKLFNCKPGEVRMKERVKFQQAMTEGVATPDCIKEYSITKMKERRVFFTPYVGPYGDEYVSEQWCSHIQDAQQKDVISDKTSFIGIVHDDPDITSENQCRYDCCITTESFVHDKIKTIAGGSYAIFQFSGSCEEVFQAYRWIYGQWFPQSGYEPANLPSYEEYCHFKVNTPIIAKLFRYNICIPVVKL